MRVQAGHVGSTGGGAVCAGGAGRVCWEQGKGRSAGRAWGECGQGVLEVQAGAKHAGSPLTPSRAVAGAHAHLNPTTVPPSSG